MAGFHIPTAFVIAGLMFLFMPIFTWLILAKQASAKINWWCASGVILGFGAMLLGMRPSIPVWMSYPLANFLIVLGGVIRIQSLRLEITTPWRTSWLVLCATLVILVYELIRQSQQDASIFVAYMVAVYFCIFSYTAWLAWQISQKFNCRSAIWIAVIHGLMAIAFVLRLRELGSGGGVPDGVEATLAAVIIAGVAIFNAIIANIAYAGMKLEQEHVKLVKAEDAYDAILKTTHDGFLVADDSGHLVDVNDIFCQMVGYSRDELLGMGVSDLKAEQSRESVHQLIQSIKAHGFSRYETVYRCKDDHLIDVEVSVTYLPDMDPRFLVFVRDITERKLFQLALERRVMVRTAELATARAEAESANAVKTRFMSNVSHEMRTPLQGILGFAELGKVKLGSVSDEKLATYFDAILDSGYRMRKLVESLLSLVQTAWNEHSGLAGQNLVEILPEALVSQSICMMENTAKARQQRIDLVSPESTRLIQGDEPRLRQVLEYLLGNALRYSPEASTVKVKIEDSVLSDGWRAPREAVRIEVIDEGCGVPEKEMQAIFEPFYESTRTSTGAGGTGLGLALCQNIVKRHQGTLGVANRPEGGAVFAMVLPMRLQES